MKTAKVERPKVITGGRFSGTSIGEDKNGVYCHTHRARSKSYPSKEKIPQKVVNFIKSTG